uniref:Calpain catalytic domain-containing protein n=1 Tax=Anabas testudineus TaxID=64144 RepID=A0A7N6ABN7_ANATE
MTSTADRVARQQDRDQGIGTNQNAVKFCQQDYDALRQQCLKRGRLFEDDCFPAENKSLGYNELGACSSKTKGVLWKRPTELCADPKFICDGATRTDICQGALGDCWLLAAIASLTLDQQFLDRVVPSGQSFTEDYAGIFHFQLWQYGEWVDVVVDDRLPTKDGKLLFVHSPEGSEFWSALLEKAYAKVNGSYEALTGGNTIEGFEDFTGGIAESYDLSKAPPKLFQIMQKALKLGSLMGCSIDITSAYETEAITALKLVKGHAYSVTGAEEVHYQGKVVQLVRIRNPWGQVEWTGPWSDESNEWKCVSEDEKKRLDNVAEDGEFWMAFADFTKQFSKLEICNLTPDTLTSDEAHGWNPYQFEGMWRIGSTAGGCRNHSATFPSNPQFVLRLEDVDDHPVDGKPGCTFLVGLMQKNGRQQRRLNRDLETIGFAIYKIPDQVCICTDVLLRQRAVAMSSNFINTREVCDRFKLPPGEYAIVPSTFQPHKNASFVLRVFSEKNIATSLDAHLVDKSERPCFGHGMVLNSYYNVYLFFSPMEAEIHAKIEEHCDTVNLNITQKDENNTLGLVEFQVFWKKLQKYLVMILRAGDTTNDSKRRLFFVLGFQVNSAVLQAIVNRYADAQYAIDFDNFVGCLIKLEMLFKMFKSLDKGDSGKIELDMQQVGEKRPTTSSLSARLL